MARLSVTDGSTSEAQARALGRAGAGPSTGAAACGAAGALNLGVAE